MEPRCDLCKHWHYVYPEDLGTCDNPNNTSEIKGISTITLKGGRKTSCWSSCSAWESDGTELATSVNNNLFRNELLDKLTEETKHE